jgi:sulfite reductase alpha subunit-like flavoprotein
VQHIISQHVHHLTAAISSGACIIVCGAAQQMPKAVFASIAEALATGSNMSVEDAEKVLQGTQITRCHSLRTCL